MMGQIMASYYVHFVYKVNIMVIHKKECQGSFFKKEVHIVFFDTKRKNTVVWSFSITYDFNKEIAQKLYCYQKHIFTRVFSFLEMSS